MDCDSVAKDFEMSIRRRSQEVALTISRSTTCISQKDSDLNAHKLQITQQLKPLYRSKIQKFPGRIIPNNVDINWSSRSCELTPLIYFLWSYVKNHVYKNISQSITKIKNVDVQFVSLVG